MYHAIESLRVKVFNRCLNWRIWELASKRRVTVDLDFVMNIISSYRFTRNKLKAMDYMQNFVTQTAYNHYSVWYVVYSYIQFYALTEVCLQSIRSDAIINFAISSSIDYKYNDEYSERRNTVKLSQVRIYSCVVGSYFSMVACRG